MEVILRMVFIAFLAVSGMLLNFDLSTKAQTLHYLKEDLEIAAHDAALEIDDDELATGKIVFDQSEAMTSFRNSLERNSHLDSTDYEIVEINFFDHSTVESFPYEFTSDDVGFSDVIESPTVIAFVETKRNAYFTNNSEENFVQVASYTYKTKVETETPIDKVVAGAPNEQGFYWPSPFTKNHTSSFGMRTNPVTGVYKLHAGADIAAPGILNTPVTPAKSGKVKYAGWIDGYGNVVVITHGNGIETRYAHLNKIATSDGAQVEPGQVIGYVGSTGNSTGPHLHFEIRIDGKPYDPVLFY